MVRSHCDLTVSIQATNACVFLDPAISYLAIYLADIFAHIHKNLYSKYIIAALFKYKRLKTV